MSTYQKIPGPFLRDPKTNKLTYYEWSSREIEVVASLADWFFTEKLDGTNVRVYWDGYRVTYAGRTDNATFDVHTKNYLDRFLTPEFENLVEQKFGDSPVVLYGELYGPKIQKGGIYRKEISFALFDVYIGGFWLSRENVEDISASLGLEVVPLVSLGSLRSTFDLLDGIHAVESGFYSPTARENTGQEIFAEGLVARLRSGLLNRKGERIIVKLKHRDLYRG